MTPSPTGACANDEPPSTLANPMAMSTVMIAMKQYVGTAKIRPDSLTPRRLP